MNNPGATSSRMTLEEIDRLLVAWRANLEMSTQNLLALDDVAAYKRLTGGDSLTAPPLSGITAQRVPPALADIAQLFDNLQVLNSVIDRATGLREAMPRIFSTDHSRGQIEALLTGNSIELPPVQTPLAQRGLLSQSEKPSAVSPSFLLDVMQRTFDQAKAVIMEVDAAWAHLEPDLAAMNDEAARLKQLSASLGQKCLPELSDLESQISHIQRSIATDPLGAGADVRRRVEPLLQRARTRINALVSDRDRLQQIITEAQRLMSIIRDTHQRSIESLRVCREQIQIQVALKPVLADNVVPELSSWLDTLVATFNSGQVRPAQVGLSRWCDSAHTALAAAQSSLQSSSSQVELLAELRGRFAAQRARAKAAAARGVITDSSLVSLETEANRILALNVVPVENAARVVELYEHRLRIALGS